MRHASTSVKAAEKSTQVQQQRKGTVHDEERAWKGLPDFLPFERFDGWSGLYEPRCPSRGQQNNRVVDDFAWKNLNNACGTCSKKDKIDFVRIATSAVMGWKWLS